MAETLPAADDAPMHDWMPLDFASSDSLNGDAYLHAGFWCCVCGALDFGKDGPEFPRYWSVGSSRGSYVVSVVEPKCCE
jgi:hypothetical protein